MGVPTSEVGYTPAMPRREDHEVHKGHVVALGGDIKIWNIMKFLVMFKIFNSVISFKITYTKIPTFLGSCDRASRT